MPVLWTNESAGKYADISQNEARSFSDVSHPAGSLDSRYEAQQSAEMVLLKNARKTWYKPAIIALARKLLMLVHHLL